MSKRDALAEVTQLIEQLEPRAQLRVMEMVCKIQRMHETAQDQEFHLAFTFMLAKLAQSNWPF
jgi:hypothetical protein